MNNNKENYKNAMNQIHPSEQLKNETIEKMTQKKKFRPNILIKYAAACAVFALCLSVGTIYLKDRNQQPIAGAPEQQIAKADLGLPRFKNMDELKDVLKTNSRLDENDKSYYLRDTITSTETAADTAKSDTKEYSKTNTQVDNVDEADVVKTDGDYIYYLAQDKIYIINSKNLTQESVIEFEKGDNAKVNPSEIYIYKDKLIVLENSYTISERRMSEDVVNSLVEVDTVSRESKTVAQVYDISNKQKPELIRELELDGNYMNSRMIGNKLYLISSKSAYYTTGMRDVDLLPMVKDTVVSEEAKAVECTDIAYFEGDDADSFLTVAGFNVENKEPASIETILGSIDEIYASEQNLYVTQQTYTYSYITDREKTTTTIYKFNLIDGSVKLQAKTEIAGNIKNQFSMDEYQGKLRVASTSGYTANPENVLYILDEDLKEIGKIDNMANGEKIYAVRFMQNKGYIVTFEQIDPLFVIDLSDPTAPEIKGQLKIPGYSSYLHPYDETHIIGIGYNTKSNGYGGVTNANIKMSMFDVSDLNNPKEIFNVSIGSDNVYSEVNYNHKALFYNAEKNLIGFALTDRNYRTSQSAENNFVMYKIDLEKGFQEYGTISQKYDWPTNVYRAIYIEDNLYALSETKITRYDLNTIEKIKELELK